MQIEIDINELAKALKTATNIIKLTKDSHYPNICLRFSSDKRYFEVAVADAYRLVVCSVAIEASDVSDENIKNNYLVKPTDITKAINKLTRDKKLNDKRRTVRFENSQLHFTEPDKIEEKPIVQVAFKCDYFAPYQDLLARLHRENLTSYCFGRAALLELTKPTLSVETEPNEENLSLLFEAVNLSAIMAEATVNFKVKTERARVVEKGFEMQELGASEISATYSAMDNQDNICALPVDRFALNPALLKSIIEAISTEQIALLLSNQDQPVLIKAIGNKENISIYALATMHIPNWNKGKD